jgi:hypothetical protein
MEKVYIWDRKDTGQAKGVVTVESNPPAGLLTKLLLRSCQIYCDALHRKFGRTIAMFTIALLATAVIFVVAIFSIVDAVVPLTRQTLKEISRSSAFYFKLLAIGVASVALSVD